MPITFYPSDVKMSPVIGPSFMGIQQAEAESTAKRLLRQTVNWELGNGIDQIIQSSFPIQESSENTNHRVQGSVHGLVGTIVHAYNGHHALVIRPDDVWLAILTQFSFFVTAPSRAEALRHHFVAHEGKKELKLYASMMDFAVIVPRMTELMHENVVDPELRAWIMPDFETTTDTDRVAASVIMMATLKNYFSYNFRSSCGIPKVTILGCKADWEALLERIEKLKEYGPETSAWYALLRPVLLRFCWAFDDGIAHSRENREFWRVVCHATGGSGVTWLSGWITAFCMFDEKGNWQGDDLGYTSLLRRTSQVAQTISSRIRQTLPWNPSSNVSWSSPHRGLSRFNHPKPRRTLVLDGVWYPTINYCAIPPAHAEVTVKLSVVGVNSEAMMVAGVVATKIEKDEVGKDGDQLSPMVGWWVFTQKVAERGEENLG